MMHGTRFLIRYVLYLQKTKNSKATTRELTLGAITFRHGYLKRSNHADDRDYDPVIINVSSLLGLHGGYGAVAYAAAKAGVLGFTRALATEYATHKVRVNAIVPGYVDTDMTKGAYMSLVQHA